MVTVNEMVCFENVDQTLIFSRYGGVKESIIISKIEPIENAIKSREQEEMKCLFLDYLIDLSWVSS